MRRALDVYGPPGAYGYGWWQAVARRSHEGTGRVRLCAYVKHSALNSVIKQELRDRGLEDGANVTSSADRGLCPCESLHPKGSDKIYVNKKC